MIIITSQNQQRTVQFLFQLLWNGSKVWLDRFLHVQTVSIGSDSLPHLKLFRLQRPIDVLIYSYFSRSICNRLSTAKIDFPSTTAWQTACDAKCAWFIWFRKREHATTIDENWWSFLRDPREQTIIQKGVWMDLLGLTLKMLLHVCNAILNRNIFHKFLSAQHKFKQLKLGRDETCSIKVCKQTKTRKCQWNIWHVSKSHIITNLLSNECLVCHHAITAAPNELPAKRFHSHNLSSGDDQCSVPHCSVIQLIQFT